MAGSITKYATAAGPRYRVRYRKPSNQRQTDKRGFKTKREAEVFLASVTIAKAVGDYIDPALSRVKVEQLADRWLAGKRPPALKPSAYKPLEISWRLHVQPRWGDREIRSIVPSEVQEWVTQLSQPLGERSGKSATVVLRALGVLAGILDMAIDDGRMKKNPARGLRNLPKKLKRKAGRSYLTIDQVHQLAAEARYPTLVLVLAYTGLRWGEATALRVRHLNTVRRRLHVEENAVQVDGVIHLGTPKSSEHRHVPYPKFLEPYLVQLTAGKGPDSLLFGDGLVHLRPSRVGTGWFEGAVSRARAADPTFPRITPHDLRHTAASIAVSTGANVKAVQHMLGHESASMTLDTYADLFPDDLEAVADRMDAATRAASVGKSWASALA
ncbi:tyrosine-type recombinase/integrase [Microbacterium sp. Yaish 1]|uniref:tyrosine-type recombinase/integrase n=1 Tax=Microbacterium sp. Yaish 1 TaxID=2025014 RepID=UPI000B93F2F6|nr:tyrosine-type recombinase/integrase [Microbacterium sp. Yaish 1]OYC97240.1 site-specific integrase [Microbacterium sp. Yaish 1]